MLDLDEPTRAAAPEPWIAVVEPPTGPVANPSADAPAVHAVGERWARRPWLSVGVRATAFVAPIVAAVAVSLVIARFLPAAADLSALMMQWALLLIVGTLVAKATRAGTKRLLPLSALFELSLIFPDQAPSRVATALRRPSDEELARIVDRTKRHGLPTDATEAASTVLTLVTALSEHDRLTRGHSERVRVYATMIAEEMGLSAADVSAVQWAGLLHDVGKLGVDDAILNKPGRLTDDEYELVQTHTLTGAVMVEPLRWWLGDAVDAAAQHHERWDGGGYPYGLAGEEISLAARIVAVADVYDVITAKRSYKDPLPAAWARREIADGAGTQFDPKVVRAFLAISLNQIKVATGPFAWMAQVPILASLPMATVAAPMTVVPAAKAATAAVVVAAATSIAPVDVAPVERAPVTLTVVEDGQAGPAPLDAARTSSPVSKPAAEAPAPTSTAKDVGGTAAPKAPAPQKAPKTPDSTATGTAATADPAAGDASPTTDGAASVRAAYAEAVEAVRSAAAAAMLEAEQEHAEEIAAIERELAEAVAELDADHADDLADIAALTAATSADVAAIEAKRDAKLAELADDFAADLQKQADKLAADLADAKDAGAATEASIEDSEKVATIYAAYTADVTKVREGATEDIAAKQQKLADARDKVLADYDRALAGLQTEAQEARADADADLADTRAKIAADRDRDIAKLTVELDEDLAALAA